MWAGVKYASGDQLAANSNYIPEGSKLDTEKLRDYKVINLIYHDRKRQLSDKIQYISLDNAKMYHGYGEKKNSISALSPQVINRYSNISGLPNTFVWQKNKKDSYIMTTGMNFIKKELLGKYNLCNSKQVKYGDFEIVASTFNSNHKCNIITLRNFESSNCDYEARCKIEKFNHSYNKENSYLLSYQIAD